MASPIGFDLFVLLVEYVVGSILGALLVWALILLVTGIMGRMSMQSILIILVTYLATVSMGYIGALAGVPIFIWACWYAVTGIVNNVNQMR